MTITISNKELKGYLDAIYGAINASNLADNETDGTREKDIQLIERNNKLFDVCKNLTDRCGLTGDDTIVPARKLLDACNKRVTSLKKDKETGDKEFKAISGSAFRKWVKEYMTQHMGVEFASASGEKKKTVKIDTSIYDEFCAWLDARNNPNNK